MKPLFAVLLALILFTGCQKDDGGNPSSDRVKITGKIATTKSAIVDASEATKVLLFDTGGEITTSDIVDGAFTVQVNKDEPVGIIFSNEAKKFLGYLTLGQGIESLPLNYLNDTVSVVNLGQLAVDGTAVSSSANILTQMMQMNSEQLQKYRYASVNFSLMVKNPDTDRNGIIDLMEGKYFRLAYVFFGNGGNFQTTPVKSNAITVDQYRVMFISTDSNTPADITFSSLDGTKQYTTNYKSTHINHTIFWTDIAPVSMPMSGQCKVFYGDQTLYFEIPEFTTSINNLIHVFPTLQYDGGNKLTKVSWDYFAANTGAKIDATRLLTDIIVQIEGANGRIYDSKNYSPESTEDVLTKSVILSEIQGFNMAYNDIFGNHMVIGYRKQ